MIGRFRVCVSVLLLAATGPVVAAPKPARPPVERDAGLLRDFKTLVDAETAYDKGDCATTIKLARPVSRNIAEFRRLPNATQIELAVWEMLARCHAQAKDWVQAAADIRQATDIAAATDPLWHLRLDVDFFGNRWAPLVETIEVLGRDRPETLNGLSIEFLGRVNTELRRTEQKALRARFLAVLAADSFKPTEFMASSESFRRDYAVHLGATGQKEAARALVVGLTHPWTVARVSLDPNLRAFFPSDPDLRALAERELAKDRALVEKNPDRLEPVIAVAVDLQLLGRPQDALAVLQSVAGRIDDPKAFVDRAKQLPWWWDELSDVYEMLGRFDEAIDALKKGGELAEGGGANVSQTINLAHMQVRAGRNDAALATLTAFKKGGHDISPYGQIALRSARACASHNVGNAKAAKADVDYIRARQLDAPGSLGNVLQCVGDLDGAAAALIARLEDPEQSAYALLALSDYAEPPVKLPEQPMARALKALKARPDVQAAIERAGGTRRFNIQDL
jgi:tetratricopeptide (TPR) repeat protein